MVDIKQNLESQAEGEDPQVFAGGEISNEAGGKTESRVMQEIDRREENRGRSSENDSLTVRTLLT